MQFIHCITMYITIYNVTTYIITIYNLIHCITMYITDRVSQYNCEANAYAKVLF